MDLREMLNSNPDEFMARMMKESRQSILFKREDVVKTLLEYGEPEVAKKLSRLGLKALREIGYRAHEIYSDFSGAHGPRLDIAICRAAVEYIEGKPRPLKRKRRVVSKARK